MKTTNALDVRRSLGKVLDKLEDGGEPIIVERAGRPVAALVAIADFRERFADRTAGAEREALVAEILAERPLRTRGRLGSVAEIRRLRGRLP